MSGVLKDRDKELSENKGTAMERDKAAVEMWLKDREKKVRTQFHTLQYEVCSGSIPFTKSLLTILPLSLV